MTIGEKPVITAQAAQQAAAYAHQMAQTAQEAADLVNSTPGTTPAKTWILRALTVAGYAAGVVTAFATGGIAVGVGAIATGGLACWAALNQPSPAAVAKFGQGVAK